MEEKERKFKPLVTTNESITTGRGQPISKSLIDIGLTEANSKGEANIRKSIKNPKGAGKKPKERDKSYYPLHKFIEIGNNVLVVLIPDSKLEISNYTEFIEATESAEYAKDIVDILPPIYNLHFSIMADVDKRFMIGDIVNVNFKFRDIIELNAIKQKEPQKIVDIKFINLHDMSVLVAYLENKDFYLINELDHYDTD